MHTFLYGLKELQYYTSSVYHNIRHSVEQFVYGLNRGAERTTNICHFSVRFSGGTNRSININPLVFTTEEIYTKNIQVKHIFERKNKKLYCENI